MHVAIVVSAALVVILLVALVLIGISAIGFLEAAVLLLGNIECALKKKPNPKYVPRVAVSVRTRPE